MNSLVWVSSTSVHSLLRKAGTFELCFIVNEAQGFQIPHGNAAAAAAAARRGGSGSGGGGGSCSPRTPTTQAQQLLGPAPPTSGAQLGGEALRPHVMDKAPRSPVSTGAAPASFPANPRRRPRTEKSDWMLRTWRGWDQKGALPSRSPFIQEPSMWWTFTCGNRAWSFQVEVVLGFWAVAEELRKVLSVPSHKFSR